MSDTVITVEDIAEIIERRIDELEEITPLRELFEGNNSQCHSMIRRRELVRLLNEIGKMATKSG